MKELIYSTGTWKDITYCQGWHSNRSLKEDNESTTERSESEMKLLEGTVEEKVLGTVWNHNGTSFPCSFLYAPSWKKHPGWGWSRAT